MAKYMTNSIIDFDNWTKELPYIKTEKNWVEWNTNTVYESGKIVRFSDDILYKCIRTHISNIDSIIPGNVVYWRLYDESSKFFKYNLEDYSSFDFRKIEQYIDDCEHDFFGWYDSFDDDKIEKIAYDIYGEARYWDLLILVNKRNPLYDMPYRFDLLESMIQDKIDKLKVLKPITEQREKELYNFYLEELEKENDILRQIRYVKPEKISEFIKLGRDKGCFR